MDGKKVQKLKNKKAVEPVCYLILWLSEEE